jgi:hypothetical protein
VLGIGSPSSTHPCPICIITRDNLLGSAAVRDPLVTQMQGAAFAALSDPQQQRYATSHIFASVRRSPLLAVAATNIVPLPLHLLLGICNRIIGKVYPLLVPELLLSSTVGSVKDYSVTTPGAASVFELNGKAVSRWVSRGCDAEMLEQLHILTPPATLSALSTLAAWMQGLHTHLLHKREWSPSDAAAFVLLICHIHTHWTTVTASAPFPKLHMLLHAAAFAMQHRHLGKYAESQIESYHALYNQRYNTQHNNQGSHIAERSRRSHADTLIARAVSALRRPQ